MGQYFQDNFGDDIYDTEFTQNTKNIEETQTTASTIDPNNPEQRQLNAQITIEKMTQTLNKCNSQNPGPDGIPYIFLQNLGIKSKPVMLNIYNKVWETGNIPMEWKKQIIIPILKAEKDKNQPEGYKPIILLNTTAETLEKIV